MDAGLGKQPEVACRVKNLSIHFFQFFGFLGLLFFGFLVFVDLLGVGRGDYNLDPKGTSYNAQDNALHKLHWLSKDCERISTQHGKPHPSHRQRNAKGP